MTDSGSGTIDEGSGRLDRWVREFEEAQSKFVALQAAAVDDLRSAIASSCLDGLVHDIRYRIKRPASFREKIERKNYQDPLNDMHDLLGIRVVCIYPSALVAMDDVIRNAFTVWRYEDKSRGESPELWRYSSIHYDCCIPDSHSGPRYDPIKNIIFEIQVRTILQDAWATVEHRLGYKNEKSIPDDLKREFSALAGLFHIADKSFQNIANEVKRSEQEARDSVEALMRLYNRLEVLGSSKAAEGEAALLEDMIKNLESRPEAIVDRSNLKALLRGLYAEREPASDSQYSEFVEELGEADVSTLGSLRQSLQEGMAKALELESKRPGFDGGRLLNDVGAARLAISVLSSEFRDILRRRQEGVGDRR